MTDISLRDLSHNVSAVLRRVEHGERLRVTMSGRAVAELLPPPSRPRSMAWSAFIRNWDRWSADPALAGDLAELLPAATDNLPTP
jgi:prevent-host-death family protein